MKRKLIHDLSNQAELLEFMFDCISTINEIPNWEVKHGWDKSLELNILKGETNAIEIFDRYNSGSCPMNSGGYYHSLSQKTKNTFDYVIEYGRYGLNRLCNDGVVYTKYGWCFQN